MNSKELKGLPVLSIEDGAKLGTVSRTYVDGHEKRIAGFAFSESGGFLQVESEPKLDSGDVRSLGPDALIIENREAVRGATIAERYADMVVLDDVSHLPVMSESGTSIGQVASLDFDNHSLDLTGLELSSGLFQAARTIPIDKVITIGPDYVVVDDSALQLMQPAEASEVPASADAPEGSAV